jgi:carbonic anhydrase-like protein
MTRKFGTAISCFDARIQLPIQQWLRDNYKIEHVDTITEHGIVKLFSRPEDAERIKAKLLHSIEHEDSKIVLVSAHHDCEGNPVTKNEQISQIRHAVSVIESWKLPISVLGVWVNEQFQVEPMM